MSFIYKVNLNGDIQKFIDVEVEELGNWGSCSEIVIEGLSDIYADAIKSGLVKQ